MTATISREAPTFDHVLSAAEALGAKWAAERQQRQGRRTLDPADFQELRDAGVHLMAVPIEFGGLWAGVRKSTRRSCEILRALAKGDPSVALVAVMHTAVLQDILTIREAPEPYTAAWDAERRWIFDAILAGAWFGTAGSEPDKSSDREPPQATAKLDPTGAYRLTGRKHFASGTGIASYMVTTANPEGEASHSHFYLDLRGALPDGSAGFRIEAPWDGKGMTATQSHALGFEDFPAVRSALPADARGPNSPFFPCAYTAVVLGVVETAMAAARAELQKRGDDLQAFEQVEWVEAGIDAWLMSQAYEGMLRSFELGPGDRGASIFRGKIAAARLAESALARICRVIGARTYSERSAFSHWFEDVRALGFLRPSWRMAYDQLMAADPIAPA